MPETIKPRSWTDVEKLQAGYHYYERKRQLVMAARLPQQAAPLEIHYPLETVQAEAGDVICFDPGATRQRHILDYDHWSVKLDIFMTTYRNSPIQRQTPAIDHLLAHGCKPYYKYRGAWARQLDEPTYIMSLESVEPALIPPGVWVVIGEKGEPWEIDDKTFRARYVVPD